MAHPSRRAEGGAGQHRQPGKAVHRVQGVRVFRDLIPAVLAEEEDELQYGRQRLGLSPDFKLWLPTPEGLQDCLGELKFISAGVLRYPEGRKLGGGKPGPPLLHSDLCRGMGGPPHPGLRTSRD